MSGNESKYSEFQHLSIYCFFKVSMANKFLSQRQEYITPLIEIDKYLLFSFDNTIKDVKEKKFEQTTYHKFPEIDEKKHHMSLIFVFDLHYEDNQTAHCDRVNITLGLG